MRLPHFLESLFTSQLHREPSNPDDSGLLTMPIAPSVLLEQLGVREYLKSRECGFTRQVRIGEFDQYQSLFLGAAATYQALPATGWTHHREFGGMLMHGIEVAVDLVRRVRDQSSTKDLQEVQTLLGADRSLTIAVLLAYGLHHDYCSLISGIKIHFFNPKTHERIRTFSPSNSSLTLYEKLIREPSDVAYQWEFDPCLNLDPCTFCMRLVFDWEMRKAGQKLSDEQLSMLFNTDSPLRDMLNDFLVKANNLSTQNNRRNEPLLCKSSYLNLERALFYAATRTGLLDTAPVRLGAIYLSNKRISRIGRALPNFDEFFNLKLHLKHSKNPLAALDGGLDGFRFYYPRENGYWLSSAWHCTKELICLKEQRRARG